MEKVIANLIAGMGKHPEVFPADVSMCFCTSRPLAEETPFLEHDPEFSDRTDRWYYFFRTYDHPLVEMVMIVLMEDTNHYMLVFVGKGICVTREVYATRIDICEAENEARGGVLPSGESYRLEIERYTGFLSHPAPVNA